MKKNMNQNQAQLFANIASVISQRIGLTNREIKYQEKDSNVLTEHNRNMPPNIEFKHGKDYQYGCTWADYH